MMDATNFMCVYLREKYLRKTQKTNTGWSERTGSVAEERHLWIRASNVVLRIRCSSGMGFFVIFSVGKDCTCWGEKSDLEHFPP